MFTARYELGFKSDHYSFVLKGQEVKICSKSCGLRTHICITKGTVCMQLVKEKINSEGNRSS